MTVNGAYTTSSSADDKIGLVVLPGATLTLSPTSATQAVCGGAMPCLLSLLASSYNWIEGTLIGTNPATQLGIQNVSGKHAVFRNLRMTGWGNAIGDANSGYISSLYQNLVLNNNGAGLSIKGNYNTVLDVMAANNAAGIFIGDSLNNPVLQSVVIANSSTYNLFLNNNNLMTATALTLVNAPSNNITHNSAHDFTIHNFLFQNNATDVNLFNAVRDTFSQGGFDSFTSMSATTGKIGANWVTSSAPTCSITGGTNPGLANGTCATQGSSSFVRTTGNGIIAPIGKISTSDLTNTSNNNGVMAYASITDWLGFENLFRGWGLSGTFPGAGSQGQCTSGICQIWDWRLSASDTRFRNTTANGSTQNAAFVNGAACPAQLHGNTAVTDVAATPKTYLTNAIEILGTGGNNNGLCESNESCLYTPNFGAYQGEGDFWSNTCTFVNGVISGVTMYAYPTNSP